MFATACLAGRRLGILSGFATLALLALAPARAADPGIPLAEGLVVTSASHFDGQDYEVLRIVDAIDPETVTFRLHRSAPLAAGSDEMETLTVVRVVRVEDLRSANRMVAYFHSEDPLMFPGSTAFQASTALLESLKSGADTPFVFGMAAGPLGSWGARKYYRGNLKLVEPPPVPMSVLLDGERAEVPAIHVKGTLAVGEDVAESEFWFLDEPGNAQTLRWTFKDTVIQVVRIDRRVGGTKPLALDAGLASEACRAELHGVFFDTGSAALLEESGATIAEAGRTLEGHGDWRVTIEGHTDDIGSDADNLRLSQARADAVRTALIDLGIAADRLTATGFGESRPVESNETIEGRARNRRVELSRDCP